jgi:hypothetical protein
MTANQIDPEKLAKAAQPEFRNLPLTGRALLLTCLVLMLGSASASCLHRYSAVPILI